MKILFTLLTISLSFSLLAQKQEDKAFVKILKKREEKLSSQLAIIKEALNCFKNAGENKEKMIKCRATHQEQQKQANAKNKIENEKMRKERQSFMNKRKEKMKEAGGSSQTTPSNQ